MAQQTSKARTTEDKPLTEGTIPASVAGDDGQAVVREVPASRAAGTVPPAAVATLRYTTQEGTDAGNRAPSDLYMDDATGKVVTTQPERGTLLARKGGEVTPAAARMIQDADGS